MMNWIERRGWLLLSEHVWEIKINLWISFGRGYGDLWLWRPSVARNVGNLHQFSWGYWDLWIDW